MGNTARTMCTTYRLEPATAYILRVRTVRKGSASEWSAPIKEFTKKIYSDDYAWVECPEYVDDE